MENYRKHDSFYEDQYDRRTIKILKQLENESIELPMLSKNLDNSFDRNSLRQLLQNSPYNALSKFYNEGVLRWRFRTN